MYDADDTLRMRFEYADARMPVAVTKGGATYYLAYDQVGTLKAVADASGNVIKKIEYDTFGNIISDSNPAFAVPFGFAGGLYDSDTKLVRFGYRDYDPETGRWTAKDPIGFSGGDTDLYGYCVNDPVNWVDPEGFIRKISFTKGPYTVSKPESHPGEGTHVHWGTDKRGENGGKLYDNGQYKGKEPPGKLLKEIMKRLGWLLKDIKPAPCMPFIMLPGMEQILENLINGMPPDFNPDSIVS